MTFKYFQIISFYNAIGSNLNGALKMIRYYEHFFLHKSKAFSILIGTFLVMLFGFIDLSIDYRISFSIFYVLPIIFVTWHTDYKIGFVFSFLSSCFWFMAAYFSYSPQYPIPILLWNSIVRFGFFIIITYTIHIFKNERRNARYDSLTKIPNRRFFDELFYAEMKRSIRYKHPMTIVYMDVDDFKTINDMHGHYTGDNLLKIVASVIKKNIRSTDIVARLGGDEFGIILIETNKKAALEITQKLKEKLISSMEEAVFPVTFSFGVVTFRKFPPTIREMLKMADDCMYKAKKEGKNKIEQRVVA